MRMFLRWLNCQLVSGIAIRVFSIPLRTRLLLLPQDGADAVDISCDHRQCNITPEPINSMIRTSCSDAPLQWLSRRFRTAGAAYGPWPPDPRHRPLHQMPGFVPRDTQQCGAACGEEGSGRRCSLRTKRATESAHGGRADG